MCLGGYVLLGVALTPLHPGTGRSPGAVDLPVQRDSFGIPLVYASSLKGALKSKCVRELGADECKCLFGGDVGEGQYGGGAVSLVDLVPLAFPAPSPEMGYVYITSPMLLSKTLAILENVGGRAGKLRELREFVEGLLGSSKFPVATFDSGVKSLTVVSASFEIGAPRSDLAKKVEEIFRELRPLAEELPRRLLVVSDADLRYLVDKVLLRVTRVRLNYSTKTVATGALWTEEYIPYGTVFVTAVLVNPFTNAYCLKVAGRCGGLSLEKCLEERLTGSSVSVEDARGNLDAARKAASDLLSRLLADGVYVFVGGKETIGKGLMRFIPVK